MLYTKFYMKKRFMVFGWFKLLLVIHEIHPDCVSVITGGVAVRGGDMGTYPLDRAGPE